MIRGNRSDLVVIDMTLDEKCKGYQAVNVIEEAFLQAPSVKWYF